MKKLSLRSRALIAAAAASALIAVPFIAAASTTFTTGSITTSGTLQVDDDATFTNTMFVDSSNNRVGIGTTSPGTTLSIDAKLSVHALDVTNATSDDLHVTEWGGGTN